MHVIVEVKSLSRVQLFVTPWTEEPTRQDFPGKNTGEGCHLLLQKFALLHFPFYRGDRATGKSGVFYLILSENYNPYNKSDFSALLELEFWVLFCFFSQNQWKFISHSCGGWAGRLLVWQCPLPDSHMGVPHQALTCQSSGTVLRVCFIRARIPLRRAPSSGFNHPKAVTS